MWNRNARQEISIVLIWTYQRNTSFGSSSDRSGSDQIDPDRQRKNLINGKYIQRVESVKYLGVTFDCNMTWKKHIQLIVNKSKYLIFILKKESNIMNSKTLLIINYALFNSIASYGIIVWGGAYDNILEALQRLQNRFIKIVIKNNNSLLKPLNFIQNYELEALLCLITMF